MKLINITSVTKSRLKEMILWLMPAIGYVRITRRGWVIMKRHRWSLRREELNITDLCIGVLPHKIAEVTSEYGNRIEYTSEFNRQISNMIYMKYYIDSFDIVDYMWRKYTELCTVNVEPVNSATILEHPNLGQMLPEIHSLSSRSKFHNILRDIKRSKTSAVESEKGKLLKRFKNMSNGLVRVNRKWDPRTIIMHLTHSARTYTA